MALSEYEKQVLAQMEENLRQGDPDLASKMTSAPAFETPKKSGVVSVRRMAAGGALAVVGLLALVGAVSLGYSVWSILMGVVAFALMVGGILLALTPVKTQRINRPLQARSGEGGSAKKEESSSWRSFIEDQERRWDERRQSD
ncbi:DUF3040 domain-containing protein [Schaalia vaccimaxillae]|uniref:DUF3040 domain-containing protein n=1 Tax=Schaalia vaccimaxillae TaxID=183916 RepID=UPI0003B31432|nr:DUF3040 domain-containing protein [Schaalia vaccimaxillae]